MKLAVADVMLGEPDVRTPSATVRLGALSIFTENVPAGATTSTIESKTNFFRGVREGSVHATSRPLHVGRTTIVVQTDLVDDRGKRVGKVTQTQAVLRD